MATLQHPSDACPLEQLQEKVVRLQSLIEIQDLHMAAQDERLAVQDRNIARLMNGLAFMLRRADAVPVQEQAVVNSSPPAPPARSIFLVSSQP